MLAEQRRDQILDILGEKGSVSVNELYRRLKVSRETIRRDITRMDTENRLRRTHGGAIAVERVELVLEDRMEVNIEGKKAIGRLAATLVPEGASVIIDSGTTTIWLAEALRQHRHLTIYTNDIHVAGRLVGRNDNRVMLLGGEMIGTEGATLGRDTTAMLDNYLADIAFASASALSADASLMDFSREAAELRSRMMMNCRVSVLLADKTKFNQTAPVRVANLDKITHLITDVDGNNAIVKSIAENGTEILLVDTEKT